MESLYNISESLLVRDSLGGWSLSAKAAASDGGFDGWGDLQDAGSPAASTPTEPLSPVTDHQDVNPFGLGWLDTRMDLLDYLAGPELEGLTHPLVLPLGGDEGGSVSDSTSAQPDPAARAVQVLQSIAEDNDALLREEASNLPQSPAVAPSSELITSDILDLFPHPVEDFVDPTSILAPMSPEDIDSILSSGPSSPEPGLDESTSFTSADSSFSGGSELSDGDLSAEVLMLLSQVEAHEAGSSEDSVVSLVVENTLPVLSLDTPQAEVSYRPKPYERPRKPGSNKGLPLDVIQMERKLRKKQQNKDAATRYRQKKKAESDAINQEIDGLENRNGELREKVDSMTKEIGYLKDLLAEVYKARGLPVPEKCK